MCALALPFQVVLSKPSDTGYASSGSAPLSDYMVEVSSSSSFDAASTAAVRISSQNSAATVTQTLTGDDVAFLAENAQYYVRGNASNSVCLYVCVDTGACIRGPGERFSHSKCESRLCVHATNSAFSCTGCIQVAQSAYSSVVTTGQIVRRFACFADYFLWGPSRGAEKCHPCLVCTALRHFYF